MDALVAFLRRVDGDMPEELRAQRRRREAARLGLSDEAWAALRARPLDLDLVRETHRAVLGPQPRVRRALDDGTWDLAPARPGRLRTRAQAFRAGEHVESAWAPATMQKRLARVLRETAPARATDPAGAAAHLVWAITRAQPFSGANEVVALVLASHALASAGLPPVGVLELERDATFTAALCAAREHDGAALARRLVTAVWDEALTLVEWLAPAPPAGVARFTLQDEHLALARARAQAPRVADEVLERVAARLAADLPPALAARLGTPVGPGEARRLATIEARQQAAWDAASRGRLVAAHAPIRVWRWPLGDGVLAATLVLGAAGRGQTGATSVHLAVEPAGVPSPGPAPALLLVPDEPDDARQARLAAWLAPAIEAAIRRGALRL